MCHHHPAKLAGVVLLYCCICREYTLYVCPLSDMLFFFFFYCLDCFSFFLFLTLIYYTYSFWPTGQKRVPDPITDNCEPSCRCWELNSGPLQEQAMLLTSEPSLQPSAMPFIHPVSRSMACLLHGTATFSKAVSSRITLIFGVIKPKGIQVLSPSFSLSFKEFLLAI